MSLLLISCEVRPRRAGDGEVAMAGGGAPAGGESLIPGRPVAGARHGGIRKELGDVAEL